MYVDNHNSSIYIHALCGESNFLIWDESHHNFGLCFQKLVLYGISYPLFAIFSSFYIGKQTSLFIRNNTQKATLIVRIVVTACLLLLAVLVPCLLSFYAHVKMYWADIFAASVQVIAWTVHLAYLSSLRYHLSRGTRGPRPVIAAWILTLICSVFTAQTAWSISDNTFPKDTIEVNLVIYMLRVLVTTQLVLQLLYLITLFPRGRCETEASSYARIDERTPLMSSSHANYSRFHDTFDPFHLGVAEEGVNGLSFLTFHWVNLLMEKGFQRRVDTVEDLYELPYPLRCEVVSQQVQRQVLLCQPLATSPEEEDPPPTRYALLKALHQLYGLRFYSIGVLKLLSDLLGFAGPLLLNVLIQFVEGKDNVEAWMGYSAAAGICLTTLVGAFLIVHFNYLMAKINIQLRASLITSIYRKIQHLNVSKLSQFSDGEIVNMMSTDTDRVINFCQSFHAFWSLPLQMSITLYLLYRQIGIAFLAGLLFALLLIPINKVLAMKIGQLSTRMMYFKDKRLTLIKDILSKIREVKLNSWENLFKKKVMDERYGEVKALAGRKYLDAACVYFWACTPVLIPIITFGTYSALGNTMEPAKIFTAVALFNMLIIPLNAFPWVINGLVEAWVSLKRIERLMRMKDYKYNDYYTFVTDQGYVQSEVQVVILKANFSWGSNSRTEATPESVSRGTSQPVSRASSVDERASSQLRADLYGSGRAAPKFTLQDINITLNKCQIVGIVGSVGSGKTALLYSILGELEKMSGVISVAGLHQGFGLATQRPWLQNISIKDNIIFGHNLDPSRYRSVLHSCALEEDLKVLPRGEDTKCGEDGNSLSGGQKARVALARAVYQNKNIYLLDDVLSSVDAPVASQIMDRCIHGLLVGRTVILVTHYTHLLTRVDWVVQMEKGKVKTQGPPKEVLRQMGVTEVKEDSTQSRPHPQSASGAVPRSTSLRHTRREAVAQAKESTRDILPPARSPVPPEADPNEAESRSFGELNCSVYTTYLSSCGAWLAVLLFFSFVLMQASRNIVDLWLAKWVSHYVSPINNTGSLLFSPAENNGGDNYEFGTFWHPVNSVPGFFSFSSLYDKYWINGQSKQGTSTSPPLEDKMDPTTQSYLTIYILLAATNSVFTLARSFLFAYAGVCAAKVLHKKLLDAIIHTKIGFFDMNPVGRILNRFSTDIYAIDDTLPFQANIFFAQLFGLMGSLIITIYGLPWILLLYIPLMFMYFNVQHYYRHTSRELRRIYSLSLSPLYTHFTDTLQGLPVIRALRTSHRFGLHTDVYLEENQKAQFCLMLTSQWLNLRLQLIGVGILSGVVLLALWEHHTSGINPGLVGLVISYALTTSGFLNGVVTYLTETERELISVERVHQYLVGTSREGHNGARALLYDLSPALTPPPPIALPYGWPNQGQIVFENIHLKYHDHNPYSLRNVSLTIAASEKVGFVGRTGAGKSSMFAALFRLVELTRGKIFIDNVDVSEISIKKLRTCMSIVSQDVFLFFGTVRENLDPRNENLDREIESAIEQCHLSGIVAEMGGLDAPLKAGQELSGGEKQLFCLARALLSRTKIVCLDEGTSQLDYETEVRVQGVIREAFRNKTLLISTHRMHSIRDCNRVVVLSDGEIAEIGSPMELIEDKNSIFHSIINS